MLSLVFRRHVEKKRSVVGTKQRLTHDVPAQRLRINAGQKMTAAAWRCDGGQVFGRTPWRGSDRSPLRPDFTCTFRAGLNHGDRRQGALPIRIMKCDALAESERQQA